MEAARARPGAARRLLLVAPDYPPHLLGGGGMVCQRLAREYQRNGWAVTVLSMDTSRAGLLARPETIFDERIRITFLPMAFRLSTAGVSPLLSIPPSLPGLRCLSREVRRSDWDAIHLHGHPSTLVDLVATLCRLDSRPFVMTFHGVVQDPHSLGRVGYRLYRTLVRLERWNFERARAITAVSSSTLRDVTSAGFRNSRLLVVPNSGLGEGRIPSDPGERGSREGWGLVPGQFALCLGALTPRKGQSVALEAFTALMTDHVLPPNFNLVFAGYDRDQEFVEGLQRRAQELGLVDRIRWLGEVTNDQKRALLAAARWVLMPSTYEASPILAFEVLEAGSVLVASDLASFREVIGEGGSALTFRAGDPASLGRVLRELVAHPEKEQEVRIAASERARRFVSWAEIARQYLALYPPASDAATGP